MHIEALFIIRKSKNIKRCFSR